MVIVAAAAISAAAYGTYRGGKAAVETTKKKMGERQWRKTRQQEREEERTERALKEVTERNQIESMTFEQRLAKMKNERPPPLPKSSKRGLAGRFRK